MMPMTTSSSTSVNAFPAALAPVDFMHALRKGVKNLARAAQGRDIPNVIILNTKSDTAPERGPQRP